MVEVKNLIVNYGSLTAVNDISFNIKKGEFFALLGTNGAGKTTTINVLLSLKHKLNGTVKIDGEDIDVNSSLDKIAAVFQGSVLDNFLSVKENLVMRGSLYHQSNEELQKAIDYYAHKLELTDIMHRQYGKLSGGQRRKVDVARALITLPQMLILDEPTTGLDPKTRILLWDTLEEVRKEKDITILLTTHYMEEARNADNVVIMHEGVIKAKGTPNYLKEKFAYDTLKVFYIENYKDEVFSLAKKHGFKPIKKPDHIEIKSKYSGRVLEFLQEVKEKMLNFELIKGDLDTVFINVTGEKSLEVQNEHIL